MERCGKINAVNSGSESWTGIGVVAGCAVVMLITQGPHVQDIAAYWRIKLLHILQEVGSICKTRNRLLGNTLLWLGELASSHAHLAQGLTLYGRLEARATAFLL